MYLMHGRGTHRFSIGYCKEVPTIQKLLVITSADNESMIGKGVAKGGHVPIKISPGQKCPL